MQVIAVFGPTGVGKTAVAIALAKRLRERGEDPVAVSADAMQVYAGLPILTGAATPTEQAELEHRLLQFVPITDTFSAGAYAERAHREIDALLERRPPPDRRRRHRPVPARRARRARPPPARRPGHPAAARRAADSNTSTPSCRKPWRPGSRRPTASA